MGKITDVASVEVSETVKCVGTVDSIKSLKSNGGGWVFTAILNDPAVIENLSKALKKVCVFNIGISTNSGKNDVTQEDQNGLDFGDQEETEAPDDEGR